MRYLIVCAALAFAGCEREGVRKIYESNATSEVYSIEIEGHQYIIYSGSYKGGIVHSESCPCKKEEKK